jgi:prefoldin subunit 5
MLLSQKELENIKNRFRSNQRALSDLRKKLEIIETENRQLMSLISDVKETPSLEDINVERIIAKRNSRMIKR